jgi:hypothetical protein
MDSTALDELQTRLEQQGTIAAIDQLCTKLRDDQDYHNLFYALLLKKRHELGVMPVPTSPALKLPKEVHQEYEEAIRQAGHTVGELFLAAGNIPQAFPYFNMIHEREPVVAALEKYRPGENDDCDAVVNIAYHQGVHPRRGFDLILERFGICSAITTLGGQHFPFGAEVRDYCIQRVVRALYEELRARLRAEIQSKEGIAPPADTPVAELIKGRFWLFGDDFYHVDTSHLSSAVQLSIHLKPCAELELARELCEYGQRLSKRFQYPGESPFENQYKDYGIYLAVLAGDDVEGGLNHFRAKVEQLKPEAQGTYPAEVLVNLLLRMDRPEQALEVASRYLVNVDERQLSCPGIVELCERTGRFDVLTRLAREHNNAVHYLAGLIAQRTATKEQAKAPARPAQVS